jgi:hypothetical protein
MSDTQSRIYFKKLEYTWDMTRDELLPIIEKMEQYGGSFAKSLAVAMRYADSNNLQRIVNAFPEMIESYSEFLKN